MHFDEAFFILVSHSDCKWCTLCVWATNLVDTDECFMDQFWWPYFILIERTLVKIDSFIFFHNYVEDRFSILDTYTNRLSKSYFNYTFRERWNFLICFFGLQSSLFMWRNSWPSNVTGAMPLRRGISVWPATDISRSQIFEVRRRKRRSQCLWTTCPRGLSLFHCLRQYVCSCTILKI